MKAKWYRTGDTDEIIEVEPANGKHFTLKELQAFVEGTGEKGEHSKTITTVPLPSGLILVANDNGLLIGLPYNEAASKMWRTEYPIEQYPHNNSGMLVGNVLVCDRKQLR